VKKILKLRVVLPNLQLTHVLRIQPQKVASLNLRYVNPVLLGNYVRMSVNHYHHRCAKRIHRYLNVNRFLHYRPGIVIPHTLIHVYGALLQIWIVVMCPPVTLELLEVILMVLMVITMALGVRVVGMVAVVAVEMVADVIPRTLKIAYLLLLQI
jgi:hypothetical protein